MESEIRGEIILEMVPGDEHKLQISSDISKQTDIMYPAFRDALVSVKRIIESSEKYYKDDKNGNRDDRLYGYSNNIIAFCGRRGQGKTSAMISFARALEEHKKTELREVLDTNADRFYILSPIDPSMLENSSALDVILSRLYQAAEKEWKKCSRRRSSHISSEAEKREIIQLFQSCLSGACALRNSDRKDDDFENLAYLVDGLQIKVKLYELVQRFLTLLDMQSDSGYLVIQLDDTDLQLGNAYDVLDEICKYLSLPNVIVLMATDMEQLQALVGQHYLEELKLSVEKEMLEKEKIHQMAANYLNKLIPASQTIYLPSLKLSTQTREAIKVRRVGDGAKGPEDIQDYFLRQIFNKTGIAFAKQDGYLHSILPSTLRGVKHLFRLLDDMEDCGDRLTIPRYARPEEESYGRQMPTSSEIQRAETERAQYLKWLEKRERNLSRFESYLLNEWGEGRLTKRHMDKIRKILDASDPKIFECAAVVVSNKLPEPAQYINLIDTIKPAERSAFDSTEELFVFAVKLLLTIWLQKTALRCQKSSLERWDVTKNFAFKMNPVKKRFYGGIFPRQRPDKLHLFELNKDEAKTENTLFGTVVGGVFKPDALAFFENALVYDPTKDDSEEHKQIDCIQMYSLFVCCNLEVQELIRQYIRVEKVEIPDINEDHPRQFMRDVVTLFNRISDMLKEKYDYLAPDKMPFDYEGSILNALPLGVHSILEPLRPKINEPMEAAIKDLLEKITQMQRVVSSRDFIVPDGLDVLNVLYRDIASINVEDEDIKASVRRIGSMMKKFQSEPMSSNIATRRRTMLRSEVNRLVKILIEKLEQ